jgi:glyoxylase-like metal-dependent hydrolase (beta-lactamase superfamily II)
LRAIPTLPFLYRLRLGVVNAFVIEDEKELLLIDTGYPRDAPRILRAVREIGGAKKELRHILVTHCHADHSGSLAEVNEPLGRASTCTRPMRPRYAPGKPAAPGSRRLGC